MSTTNGDNELHVIFGTGPLGMSVMRALVESRGDSTHIRMVNRSGKAEFWPDAPSNVEVVSGNAYDPANTRELCKGAAVVYQCAQPAYTEWPEKFPPLQASILEGVASTGAKFIVGENLYMYGEVAGKITEDAPYNAHSRKGQTRKQMTEALMAAHKAGKVRVAVARGSDFFGPGVLASTIGDRVFYPALAGKTASGIGNIDLPHTLTYIDDFGKAMVLLGQCDEALGQVWHVPNDEPETMTQRKCMTLIFEEIGQPPKIGSIGKMMMWVGALFMPIAREGLEMMYEFDKPFVVDSSKYIKAFGNHATPIREAIRRTVAWYGAHPQTPNGH